MGSQTSGGTDMPVGGLHLPPSSFFSTLHFPPLRSRLEKTFADVAEESSSQSSRKGSKVRTFRVVPVLPLDEKLSKSASRCGIASFADRPKLRIFEDAQKTGSKVRNRLRTFGAASCLSIARRLPEE